MKNKLCWRVTILFYEYNGGVVNRETQTGVMEIYQNMKELDIQIAMAHKKAVIITGSSMGLLFLILLLIKKNRFVFYHNFSSPQTSCQD
ncbi:MAG: hypothetical protein K8F52_01550 [Candidatus Scalindua rubra]|nr:hypothetical protein [Candidatus Scalindua rubra]